MSSGTLHLIIVDNLLLEAISKTLTQRRKAHPKGLILGDLAALGDSSLQF
jgi:hypothetical protein